MSARLRDRNRAHACQALTRFASRFAPTDKEPEHDANVTLWPSVMKVETEIVQFEGTRMAVWNKTA